LETTKTDAPRPGSGRPSDTTKPIDHRSVDWPRVCRAVYRVRQHYRYTYTGPVSDIHQRLIMIPIDCHGDQRLLAYHLDVRGWDTEPRRTWEADPFGNRIGRVAIARVDHAVDFEATYRVERDRALACPVAWPAGGLDTLLHHTALTAPDDRLRAAAGVIAGDRPAGPRELADRADDWAAGAITYQFGVTGVQTPAAMALHLGRGVCQDYAHILLCLLRLLHIPARYVSGHLLGEGAPHAWVEALIADPDRPGGFEVVPYDPTNRRRAGLNYITVATGRDYSDVAPTSGSFSGAAMGKLSSSKHAEIIEIDYRDDAADEDEEAA
jgi:transglutaminase-like putative cysteine protease